MTATLENGLHALHTALRGKSRFVGSFKEGSALRAIAGFTYGKSPAQLPGGVPLSILPHPFSGTRETLIHSAHLNKSPHHLPTHNHLHSFFIHHKGGHKNSSNACQKIGHET